MVMVIPIVIRALGTVQKRIEKEEKKPGITGDQRKKLDHPDHSIVKIIWNT